MTKVRGTWIPTLETLLVGRQNGTARDENILVVTYKK